MNESWLQIVFFNMAAIEAVSALSKCKGQIRVKNMTISELMQCFYTNLRLQSVYLPTYKQTVLEQRQLKQNIARATIPTSYPPWPVLPHILDCMTAGTL